MWFAGAISVMTHALVIVIAWLGLPHLRSEPPALDNIVFVKLTNLGNVTNLPPEISEASPMPKKDKHKAGPKTEPPKTRSRPPLVPKNQSTLPPPPPPPMPNFNPPVLKSEPASLPPKQKPAPKPKPRKIVATPKPAPKPKNRVVSKKPKSPPPKPKSKKSTREQMFSSLLKNLANDPPTPSKPVEEKKSMLERARDAARNQNNRSFDPDDKVTISEREALRQQLAQCWNIGAGAKHAGSLSVEIEMVMNPDATVREAKVVDSARMNTDPYFRSAAESALRAIYHPDCVPLKLPLEKFEVWKKFTFNFDPSRMLQ